MKKYTPGQDVGPLEYWPFANPNSNYVIRDGAPRASGRLDTGGAGQVTRSGIWRCTAGVFDCTEQGDELMTVLDGECRITDHATGATHTLGPGDSMSLTDGRRVTWDIPHEVTKVFYGFKADGY